VGCALLQTPSYYRTIAPATIPLALHFSSPYPYNMTRRAKASILLLIAVVMCVSQGLSMALCRCTGHVFVGAAPESCCDDCPEEEEASAAVQAASSTGAQAPGSLILTSREDCFVVVSKGWETYLPANGKDQAPAPVYAAAEPFASLLLIPMMPRHAPTGMMSWNLTHQPEPPGPSRLVLYRSLLI
jgi:hypothetical protein